MLWRGVLCTCLLASLASASIASESTIPLTGLPTQSDDGLSGHCSRSNANGGCDGLTSRKFLHHTDIPKEMFEKGHLKPIGSHRPSDGECEVLPYMIGPQDFYEHFVARHKPVVIKGVARDWNATHLWTDEYLNEKYGHIKLNMETKDDDKFNLPPARTIGDFLKIYKEANLYLVDELPPPMRKEVTMPLCVRCDEISSRFFVSYFWMSNGDTASKLHIDTDENILTVIRGKKDLILISPLYSSDVYADQSAIIGVSPINTSHVNLLEHPRMANIRYMTAHLDEGDMLYLPQMWWHYVYSAPGRQQALAMWWKSIPFQKTFARDAGTRSRKRTAEELSKDTRTTSFARWLEEYSQWIIDMTNQGHIERPKCENQVKLMSEFPFETDKPEWRKDLTDGKAITADPTEDLDEGAIGLAGDGTRCYFDIHNKKSPCYKHFCGFGPPPGYEGMEKPEGEEPEDSEEDSDESYRQEMTCIRYMLDYCQLYEDRGCVIELPQMLNKRSNDEFEMIKNVPSKFTSED